MTSISRALQKNRTQGLEESPGGSSGGQAEAGSPNPASYPVSSIIRRASRPRGRRGAIPELGTRTAPSREAASKTWVLALLVLSAAAIGIGFLANTNQNRGGNWAGAKAKNINLAAAPNTVAAVAQSEAQIAATPTPAATPSVMLVATPAPTPIVVRVEFAAADDRRKATAIEHKTETNVSAPESAISPLPPPSIDPPKPSKSKLEDYKLEGIVWNAKNPAAMINDRIVEEGKKLGSLLVKKIEKTFVVVELDGREYELHQ